MWPVFFPNMSKLLAVLLLPVAALAQIRIVAPANPSTLEALAAREVRRYFYLSTGDLLQISNSAKGAAIVIQKDPALAPEYTLETKAHTLYLRGGSDTGILYAAYRFAERLGVRFYLHGDVIPDQKIPPALPQLNEKVSPSSTPAASNPFTTSPKVPTGGPATTTSPTSPSFPSCV